MRTRYNELESFEMVPVKTPKTFDEQVQILESRGLSIPDHSTAREFLKQVNYYPLRGYTLTLMDATTNRSYSAATFDDLIDLYITFDQKLRCFSCAGRLRVGPPIRGLGL